MKLLLKREFLGNDYTVGSLFIDGEYFCDTLEDPVRDIDRDGVFKGKEIKIPGRTAIPYGKYGLTVNYSPKFRRRLPRLLDVPDFEGILIHRGNTADDTSGCILVGENRIKGMVLNSSAYEKRLVELLGSAEGEEMTIEII